MALGPAGPRGFGQLCSFAVTAKAAGEFEGADLF